MLTRMSYVAWVGLAALVLLPPLVGCRSRRDYERAGGCCAKPPELAMSSASTNRDRTNNSVGGADDNTAQTAERLYGGQKTCPVTGEALDSMGSPVPVALKGETIYVCCPACVAKVQRDPDAYLQKVRAERVEQPKAQPAANGLLSAPAKSKCCGGS